ncbi:hypothetical protein ADUPG1_000698 [Aduncisulcus paluster]|uniref:EGF-like domain-containing protein n=1 Tax=Aduncisulcus paluster TaxID=2918883 RepID=A0ABQ5K7J4_9EUKA|nr:hypothetical protein ADUPG1_000698 [Aduncisulcus paluster]
MPVLEEGASSITCGCRAAWYGDDCDQLYQVYIPDELFRKKLCYATRYTETLCDVSEFELGGVNEQVDAYDSHFDTIEGVQYLINVLVLIYQITISLKLIMYPILDNYFICI